MSLRKKRLIKLNQLLNKKYLYIINYPAAEKGLCDLEMKALFNDIPKSKNFFSDISIDPTRSPFIKEKLEIRYCKDTIDEIIEEIENEKLDYEQFKVCYIKLDVNETSYEERLQNLRKVGVAIQGQAEMHEPEVLLGITKINGKWIFGEYTKNSFQWHIHDQKPYSYSNSLSLRVARALVSIAVGNNMSCKVVDPCCGVGTVILEALSMNIDIKGYELNEYIAKNAKRNIEFFDYKNVVVNEDMRNIKEHYDVAIVDLPYGLFTPTTREEQLGIINKSRDIANKLIIVTFEDMDKDIINAGFEIIDRCTVSKGKFTRYVSVCV